jgi:endonuclease/exonuclease/phosphatase family metal-dependent hydrolase
MTLRLVSYNIRHGGAGREQKIAEVIRELGPDLVILQEARRPAVVETIARETGMAQWGARDGQSLGFMSRETVRHVAWYKPRISRHAFVEIIPSMTDLRVFGVHLSAVHSAWTERRRTFELRALLSAVAQHQHGAHVLMGDFNTVAPGEWLEIRKLPPRLRALVWLSGGRIRWRTIQTVLDAGYRDAFRTLHPGVLGNTFPTWDPHVRLDYLFAPSRFIDRVAVCAVADTPVARTASDHLPLVAEVTF